MVKQIPNTEKFCQFKFRMHVNLQKQNLYEKKTALTKICTTAAIQIKGTALVVILH